MLAEFGSVAKYCQEKSSAPVLMLPPNLESSKPAASGASAARAHYAIAGSLRI